MSLGLYIIQFKSFFYIFKVLLQHKICSNHSNLKVCCVQNTGGADKSLARPDWKNNWKGAIFRPTRRSLPPRRPGRMDKTLYFFLSGLRNLELGGCSLFPSWWGYGLISTPVFIWVGKSQSMIWAGDVHVKGKGSAIPVQTWTENLRVPGRWGSQISWHSAHEAGKVVSPTHRASLPSQEIFLVLISVGVRVNPRITAQTEILSQWKISMTPTGIEPATFRLALCLNRLRHRVPLPECQVKNKINESEIINFLLSGQMSFFGLRTRTLVLFVFFILYYFK